MAAAMEPMYIRSNLSAGKEMEVESALLRPVPGLDAAKPLGSDNGPSPRDRAGKPRPAEPAAEAEAELRAPPGLGLDLDLSLGLGLGHGCPWPGAAAAAAPAACPAYGTYAAGAAWPQWPPCPPAQKLAPAVPPGRWLPTQASPAFLPPPPLAAPLLAADCGHTTASGGSTPPSGSGSVSSWGQEEVELPPAADRPQAAPIVTRREGKDKQWVDWAVDSKKLETDNQQIVSPEFVVDVPDVGEIPFKMTIHALTKSAGKRCNSFRSAKGRGRIELKCCKESSAPLPLTFSIGIGAAARAQPLRGPVTHDFLERSCCGLDAKEELWKLRDAVDETSRSFTIRLLVFASPDSQQSPAA